MTYKEKQMNKRFKKSPLELGILLLLAIFFLNVVITKLN